MFFLILFLVLVFTIKQKIRRWLLILTLLSWEIHCQSLKSWDFVCNPHVSKQQQLNKTYFCIGYVNSYYQKNIGTLKRLIFLQIRKFSCFVFQKIKCMLYIWCTVSTMKKHLFEFFFTKIQFSFKSKIPWYLV